MQAAKAKQIFWLFRGSVPSLYLGSTASIRCSATCDWLLWYTRTTVRPTLNEPSSVRATGQRATTRRCSLTAEVRRLPQGCVPLVSSNWIPRTDVARRYPLAPKSQIDANQGGHACRRCNRLFLLPCNGCMLRAYDLVFYSAPTRTQWSRIE